MQVLGAAIGMIVGLAILVIAFLKYAPVRESLQCNPRFPIAVVAALGGCAGYWIFTLLFGG